MIDKLDKSFFNNERSILKSIGNHENIEKYYDDFEIKINSFNYLCLITEFCPVSYLLT